MFWLITSGLQLVQLANRQFANKKFKKDNGYNKFTGGFLFLIFHIFPQKSIIQGAAYCCNNHTFSTNCDDVITTRNFLIILCKRNNEYITYICAIVYENKFMLHQI